jgi:hypothetical protein
MTLILSGTDGLSDVDGSAATPAIRGTDANTGIFFPAADTIAFSEGGLESMRIDASGNVGINTTTMTQKLNVEGSIGTRNGGHLLSTGSNTNAGGLYLDSSGSKAISLRADPDNDASGTYIGFNTDGTERARIDSSGNLLVGTTTSLGPLTVDSGSGATGFININSPNVTDANQTLGFSIQDGNHGVFLLKNGSGIAINELLFKEFGGVFKWINANTSAVPMTLDGSGNLLVGTTSAALSTNTFFKAGGAGQPVLYLFKNSVANTDQAFCVANGVAGGTVSFQVLASGNAQNTNNSYGAISDAKLKENIVDATPKLEKLNQVRIVNFNMIGDEQKQIGVIAQELEQIFPGMVEESPDYEEVTTTDEDGNETTERVATGTTTKSVKYSVFVPMLIKALQEQQAIITQLQADVAALKGTP